MKYKDIKPTLEAFREEYKTASVQRKKEIETQAETLKPYLVDYYGCYVCDEPVSIYSELFPFCTQEHKDEYNGKPILTREQKRSLPIDEIQKRLLEMAQDEHQKGNYR